MSKKVLRAKSVGEKEASTILVHSEFFYLAAECIEEEINIKVFVDPEFIVFETGRPGRNYTSDIAVCQEDREEDAEAENETEGATVGLLKDPPTVSYFTKNWFVMLNMQLPCKCRKNALTCKPVHTRV